MPDEKHPLKVFLCHASQDKPIVRELSRRLVAEGWIDVWLDEKKLLPGHDWRLNIEEAVETSDIVIICLSSNSVSKEGFVQKELRYAREIALEKPEETIFLIPLRLDECDVPRGLRFYQWADYFGEKKEETYDALLESLRVRSQQLGRATVQTPKTAENIPGKAETINIKELELKRLESQATQYELRGDFWNARKTWYEIKRIDSLFPRVDIKINELERELRPRTILPPSSKPEPTPQNQLTKFVMVIIGIIILTAILIAISAQYFKPAPVPTATATSILSKTQTITATALPSGVTPRPSLSPTKVFIPTATPLPIEITATPSVVLPLKVKMINDSSWTYSFEIQNIPSECIQGRCDYRWMIWTGVWNWCNGVVCGGKDYNKLVFDSGWKQTDGNEISIIGYRVTDYYHPYFITFKICFDPSQTNCKSAVNEIVNR
ncbi:MAG: toll/interleukin-1 receptor domain-containing protein [Anaerolineales bacterium]